MASDPSAKTSPLCAMLETIQGIQLVLYKQFFHSCGCTQFLHVCTLLMQFQVETEEIVSVLSTIRTGCHDSHDAIQT